MENQIHTKTEDFQIFELWAKYKHFWPWVLLSVIVCVGLAYFYVKITPPVYQRVAQVQIRDNNAMADIASIGGDRVLLMRSSATNEVEVFKSFALIGDVVREMNSAISYIQKNGLRTATLYDRSPVEAYFPDSPEDDSFVLRVELANDNSVIFTKLEYQNNTHHLKIVGKLNEAIKTPIGDVIISPTRFYPGYNKKYPLMIFKNSIQGETRSFSGKLKATRPSRDNAIIDLTVVDTHIPRAEKFLNTLIEKYNQNWIEEINQTAGSSLRFIEEQLPIAEQDLKMIENQLESFKRQNQITDARANAVLNMTLSSDFAIRIMEVRTQISHARNIRDYLNRNDNINAMMPVNTGLNNPNIETQMFEYNALQRERDRLQAGSSERNQQVIEMNSTLQAIRQSILLAVNQELETLNIQLTNLQAREAQMTRQIVTNPGQEIELERLQRERDIKATTYTQLLQKKQENDLTASMNTSNTRIISPPSGSNSPVSPKKNVILMIAFTFGLGIPCGFIWVKENLNTVIRGKKDLEGLSVPLLGIIALADADEQNTGAYMHVSELGRDDINETFRMVRTSLDFTCGKDMKVVMFTSFEPGSGKTFVALNLAMTFALTGKKVALVDTDLRTATLSKISEWQETSPDMTSSDLGFCSFLDGRITYTQLLQFHIRKKRYYKGFDIFPVGALPPNPAELLMSKQFSKMLENLKKRYDYVFLDCTPLDIVTDATIVSKLSDLSVFIIREEHTDRRKLYELEKIFRRGQFDKMTMILNGSKLDVSFNKYHKRYHKKVKESVKQIRGTERMKELPEEGTEKTLDDTKLLSQGTQKLLGA